MYFIYYKNTLILGITVVISIKYLWLKTTIHTYLYIYTCLNIYILRILYIYSALRMYSLTLIFFKFYVAALC